MDRVLDRNRLSTLSTTPDASRSSTEADTSRSVTPNIKLPLQSPDRTTPPIPRRRGRNGEGGDDSWLTDRESAELDIDLERGTGGVKLDNLSRSSYGPGAYASDRSRSRSTGGSRRDSQASGESNEWNSQHPCYPHRNPHVPLDSPEYESTRIIRIARDYMYSGDISPAFSIVYPEILEPYLNEDRFRQVVKRVNEAMYEAYSPWNPWNWVDAAFGMLTLWLLEDVVGSHAKRKTREVETYLKEVNREVEKSGGAAYFVPLRRTGYMNLDIQIPDPVIEVTDGDADAQGTTAMKLRMEGLDPPALMVNGDPHG